jgi:hypothetical protein
VERLEIVDNAGNVKRAGLLMIWSTGGADIGAGFVIEGLQEAFISATNFVEGHRAVAELPTRAKTRICTTPAVSYS